MPVSCEVKRTLVKSPPELWSELSDPESLARHLDGLDQIRITKTEPETAVEWEATGASGSVRLEPSGFGTKVTLSLSRQAVEPAEPEPAEPESMELESAEPEAEIGESEPTETRPVFASTADRQPRAGFFARLFRRRHRRQPDAEGSQVIDSPAIADGPLFADEPPAESEASEGIELVEDEWQPAPAIAPPAEHEPLAEAIGEPNDETASSEDLEAVSEAQATPDVTADLARLEAEMAEQDEAMLTAMLDHLGAAHHRPFSRA